jgi:hypothetical protein
MGHVFSDMFSFLKIVLMYFIAAYFKDIFSSKNLFYDFVSIFIPWNSSVKKVAGCEWLPRVHFLARKVILSCLPHPNWFWSSFICLSSG